MVSMLEKYNPNSSQYSINNPYSSEPDTSLASSFQGIRRKIQSGHIINGKFTGVGEIIHPNNMIEKGHFIDDMLTKGCIKMSNGDYIQGFFDNGSLTRGKIKYCDGSSVYGWEFNQNGLVCGMKENKSGVVTYFLNGIHVTKEIWNQHKNCII